MMAQIQCNNPVNIIEFLNLAILQCKIFISLKNSENIKNFKLLNFTDLNQ